VIHHLLWPRSAVLISRLKNTVGWFVVREKYCSGWKNKLKKTDYKPAHQVCNYSSPAAHEGSPGTPTRRRLRLGGTLSLPNFLAPKRPSQSNEHCAISQRCRSSNSDP
jgi:hypothetical protein